jgi:hypothetical protein
MTLERKAMGGKEGNGGKGRQWGERKAMGGKEDHRLEALEARDLVRVAELACGFAR